MEVDMALNDLLYTTRIIVEDGLLDTYLNAGDEVVFNPEQANQETSSIDSNCHLLYGCLTQSSLLVVTVGSSSSSFRCVSWCHETFVL